MDNFIRLMLVEDNKKSGCLYININDIEAFSDVRKTYGLTANGMVQVKGIKYTVTENAYEIYSAINKVCQRKKTEEKYMAREKESREAEEYRKSMILNGQISGSEAKKELWLDEPIVCDKNGVKGLSSRQYNAFKRHFGFGGKDKVSWRDIYELTDNNKIRNLSPASVKEAQSFIKRKLEEIEVS